MKCFISAVVVGLMVAPGALADGGAHITVDAVQGQVVIVGGYEVGEEAYTIGVDGYLRHMGEIETVVTIGAWPFDPFVGWQAAREIVLTSDFFSATGRLDGGDFAYEIVNVAMVNGPGTTTVAWGEAAGGTLIGVGRSDGVTRDARSFIVGFNGHPEFQQTMIQDEGLFDVTLRAWDRNGVYADSGDLIVRFQAIPAPGGVLVLMVSGVCAGRCRRRG